MPEIDFALYLIASGVLTLWAMTWSFVMAAKVGPPRAVKNLRMKLAMPHSEERAVFGGIMREASQETAKELRIELMGLRDDLTVAQAREAERVNQAVASMVTAQSADVKAAVGRAMDGFAGNVEKALGDQAIELQRTVEAAAGRAAGQTLSEMGLAAQASAATRRDLDVLEQFAKSAAGPNASIAGMSMEQIASMVEGVGKWRGWDKKRTQGLMQAAMTFAQANANLQRARIAGGGGESYSPGIR